MRTSRVHTLYQRYADELDQVHIDPDGGRRRLTCYGRFCRDLRHFLVLDGVQFPGTVDAPHLFACFFQIRRTFDLIFRHIIGASWRGRAIRSMRQMANGRSQTTAVCSHSGGRLAASCSIGR